MSNSEIHLEDVLKRAESIINKTKELLTRCYLDLESAVSAREQALCSFSFISHGIFVDGTRIKSRDLLSSVYRLCRFVLNNRSSLEEIINTLLFFPYPQLEKDLEEIAYLMISLLMGVRSFLRGVLEIYRMEYFNPDGILSNNRLSKIYRELDELERVYETTKTTSDTIKRRIRKILKLDRIV